MIRMLIFFFILLSPFASLYAADAKPTTIQVIETTIIVNGKPSRVFGITQPDGTFGYKGEMGELFNVVVENKTRVPTVLHWHGIIDPNDQDGVPYVTQLPIEPGKKYSYQFKLKQSGTYWFHSHYKLQEQKLMAAPLIIYDPKEKPEKDALMFVQDFTFENPTVIYEKLRGNLQEKTNTMSNMKMPDKMKGMKNMKDMKNMPTMDVSDVTFDAFLTNHKTLRNPEIVPVVPGETVRLRIINASASSNYYVDLGNLQGSLIAVDGEDIEPISGSRFQMAIGNRLDIRVKIPAGSGAYPILALPEGTKQQTGLILATKKATIPKLSENTQTKNPILDYSQELKLKPLQAMSAKPIQKSLVFNLQGDMQTYRWTINDQEWPDVTPYQIKPNERIEMVFNNKSGMAHPMHFHGHVFRVTEVNGKKVAGRKGDTIDVLPYTSMKVIFDSDNPGIWMLHCHILYHQMGGMMTTVNYENYPNRFTREQREEGEKLYSVSPF